MEMFLPKSCFPDAARRQERLIATSGSRKIVKKKAHEIENGGRLQDDGVSAGGEFDGRPRPRGLFRWRAGQVLGIEVRGRLAALALAQLAAGDSCMVTENSACVSR